MTPAFDHSIRMAVHAHATPALTAAMRAVSMIGEPTVLIVAGFAAALWLLRTGRERTALRFAAILAGAEILDQLLKLAFHRPRPPVFFGLAEPMGYSFPSGHSLVSFAFFGALALFAAPRRWWYFAGGSGAHRGDRFFARLPGNALSERCLGRMGHGGGMAVRRPLSDPRAPR